MSKQIKKQLAEGILYTDMYQLTMAQLYFRHGLHERVARFPFWDEYDKELDSDIADLKNLGGDLAGAITAGKFLARFTTRPYIHLDIAGPAFLHKPEPWKPRGGTGVGVRLFYRFLAQRASK